MTSVSTWSSGRAVRTGLGAAALALALLATPPSAHGVDEEGCLECHGLQGLAVRAGAGARPLGVSPEGYDRSAHGDLGCRECHADIASIPHAATQAVGCGQPCHGTSLGGKAYSHEGLYWEYTASSHGGTAGRKVGCLLCHPTPERRESAERDKPGEARRCAACHRGSEKVRAWFRDRHFLALAAGDSRAPSCPDCHGIHGVRPAAVAESTVNPARLADTCGSGALAGSRGGRRRESCHGGLVPSAVAAASMNVLPRGASPRGRLAAAFMLLAGGLLCGLVARAGVGLLRGR